MFSRQFGATGQLRTVFSTSYRLLTKVAHFKKKRKLRRVFSRQFGATGQLRTVFWTSYRLLTKDAKFKQFDSDADCFKANFEQQDSCAECFAKCSAFLEKSPISRTTKVSHSVLTPISSNRIVAHGVCDNFKLVNERRRVQSNRQLRRVF